MPTLNETLEQNTYFRILEYGSAMTKKTWWAGRAAEAGFNVLILDCDGKVGVLKQLSSAAKERVFVIDIMDMPLRAVASEFMTYFLTTNKLLWNTRTKQKLHSLSPEQIQTPELLKDIILIEPEKLNRNWVIVIDSYTALVESLVNRFALENNIDLSDAKKVDWDGYGFTGRMASWIISTLKQLLKCHIIVIGHKDIYEKRKTIIVNGRKEQTIEWQRQQPKSTSGPHAMLLAKHFTDILIFKLIGEQFKIEVRASSEQDGGGIFIPPNLYTWDELSFTKACVFAGMPIPGEHPTPDFSLSIEQAQTFVTKGKRATPLTQLSGGVITPETKEKTTPTVSPTGSTSPFQDLFKK